MIAKLRLRLAYGLSLLALWLSPRLFHHIGRRLARRLLADGWKRPPL